MNHSALTKITDLLFQYLSAHEIQENQNEISLVDGKVSRVIGSHYSLSHYFGGLCIQAYVRNDPTLREKSIRVFNHIFSTHETYADEDDYHYDFNNFIWSILLKLDQMHNGLLPTSIKNKCRHLLLRTGDSRHGTTNWLPMRALNNAVRFELTGDRKYLDACNRYLKKVRRVLNEDGLYEDNVKRGESANPQYHVYTLAGMILGNFLGCWNEDPGTIANSIQFFQLHIAPDGDFNYYGRGTNQIFGWGPALLVLKNTPGMEGQYSLCANFVLQNLPSCLEKDGLLLENSTEHQELQWRFYHYSSVYIAHFYFWSSITKMVHILLPALTPGNAKSKNIGIVNEGPFFALVFAGMKKYLQERGPMICGIWSKRHGCLFKGPFGPFFETPDSKSEHLAPTFVIANYLGIVKDERGMFSLSTKQMPVFPKKINGGLVDNELEMVFDFESAQSGTKFTLPIFSHLKFTSEEVNSIFSLSVGSTRLQLWKVGSVVGPYHEVDIYCTKTLPLTKQVRLRIRELC